MSVVPLRRPAPTSGVSIAETTFVVIDTETTGLSYADGDRVVEIAAINLRTGDRFTTLVNPGRSIPIETSAVHHLVDRDVAAAPSLDDAYAMIEAFVPSDAYIVAHNAAFDASMLPTLGPWPWICTKRLAQHLVPASPGHKNQILRYHFGGVDLDLGGLAPHRALADVIVTAFVFEKLCELYLTVAQGIDDAHALRMLSEKPIVYPSLPFGKHRGVAIKDLDYSYLSWARKNLVDDPDIAYTIQAEIARRARGQAR